MNIYHHSGLFIESSSLREYYKIITEAISLNRKRHKRSSPEFIYYENHHVLPRSMFTEFQLEKWNKVLLTADEHLICHKLLTLFTKGDSQRAMFNAYWNMATRTNGKMGRVTLSPDEYKNLREKISEIRHNTKRPCTDATKIKIGESNKINHNNYDLTKRKNHSELMKGPTNPSKNIDTNKKQSESRIKFLQEHPEEVQRLKELLSSKPNPMIDPKILEKVSGDNHYSRNPENKKHCIWCDRKIAPSSFSQFHGEKCKLNPNRLTSHKQNDII